MLSFISIIQCLSYRINSFGGHLFTPDKKKKFPKVLEKPEEQDSNFHLFNFFDE